MDCESNEKDLLLNELRHCKSIAEGDDKFADPDKAQMLADQALLRYINDPEISEAFEAIPKWYA